MSHDFNWAPTASYDVSVVDNLTICEIYAVFHFRHAKDISAVEISPELFVIYGQIMSERTLRHWCRMFEGVQVNKCSR